MEKVMEFQEKHSRVNEHRRACMRRVRIQLCITRSTPSVDIHAHDYIAAYTESVREKRNDSNTRDKYEWYACRPPRKAEAERTRGSSCFSVASPLTISLFDRQCSLFGSCFRVTLEFAAELLARRVSVPVCHTAKPVDTHETSDFGATSLSPLVLHSLVVSVQNAWDRVLSR